MNERSEYRPPRTPVTAEEWHAEAKAWRQRYLDLMHVTLDTWLCVASPGGTVDEAREILERGRLTRGTRP